jgi:hypothetical protein
LPYKLDKKEIYKELKPKTTIMKKLFYVLAIVIGSALCLTSCTEEEVTPTQGSDNSGGSVIEKM